MIRLPASSPERLHGTAAAGAGIGGLVSVIVPTYNTAPFIAETLESIFAQTYTSYEVIVINDGSPDTEVLEQVLRPYLRRIIYIKQENRGLAGARNTGLKAARGEYVALLDSDDAWDPTYLERQIAVLSRDPGIAVLYCDGHIFGDTADAGRRMMELSPSAGPVTFESIVARRCNVQVMVTARRASLLAAGMFDESLRSSEDFDLWLRMSKAGFRIAYQPVALTRYRRRGDSLSADAIWMCEHIIRVLDKAQAELPLTPAERRACRERQAYHRAAILLEQAKQDFVRGRARDARAKLRQANTYYRRWKLTAIGAAMRGAPGLLLACYRWRESFRQGAARRTRAAPVRRDDEA